jgi:hypothetical protein
MSGQAGEYIDEEARVEAIAEGLRACGFGASAQDTGGGMLCVVIEQSTGEVAWGTADVNWGAVVSDKDGEYVSSIATECPSDSKGVSTIVESLRNASLAHGIQPQI